MQKIEHAQSKIDQIKDECEEKLRKYEAKHKENNNTERDSEYETVELKIQLDRYREQINSLEREIERCRLEYDRCLQSEFSKYSQHVRDLET